MPPDEDRVNNVLLHWPLPTAVGPIEALGNAGGFSGSRLWRVPTESNTYCLRRWPQSHPCREQLTWIHDTLRQVAAAGCSFVPAPLVSRADITWIEQDGFLWELAPWLPGVADFHHTTPGRLQSALASLARWHTAASRTSANRSACSPGLQRRLRTDRIAGRERNDPPATSDRWSLGPADRKTVPRDPSDSTSVDHVGPPATTRRPVGWSSICNRAFGMSGMTTSCF